MTFHSDIQQILVTNNGEMYYIVGKDNRKSAREKHLYEIYYANTETRKEGINFFTVPMQEKMTFDVLFEYDNLNHNIVAGGLYSDKNRGKLSGIFL